MSEYLDKINNQKNDVPVILYIAIGCAMHRITDSENGLFKYEESINQEYPTFLVKLKQKYPESNIHIFMIDPLLEDIPFVLTIGDKKTLSPTYKKISNNEYIDQTASIHIYTIKHYAYHFFNYRKYGDYKMYELNHLDPTFFEKINDYARKNKWTVFVCDYSGMLTSQLREHYNKLIPHDLDHIIYGYIVDDDNISTCLIDTTSIGCQFIDYINSSNQIKIINPYHYDYEYYEQLPNILESIKNEDDQKIFKCQIVVFMKDKKRELNTIHFCVYGLKDALNKKECIGDKWYLKYYEQYDFICNIDTQKYDETMYKISFDTFMQYYSMKLKSYCKMVYHDDTDYIVDEHIAKLIIETDPTRYRNILVKLYIDYDDFFN